LDELREHELIHFSWMFPIWEISCLEVVSTISQNHFDSDTYHLWVEEDNSTIVEGSFVEDRASNFSNDAISHTWDNQVLDDVPRVENCVIFKEMVFTWVAGDLKFTSDSDRTIESSALFDTLINSFIVLFEVKRVIVERAEAYFDMELF